MASWVAFFAFWFVRDGHDFRIFQICLPFLYLNQGMFIIISEFGVYIISEMIELWSVKTFVCFYYQSYCHLQSSTGQTILRDFAHTCKVSLLIWKSQISSMLKASQSEKRLLLWDITSAQYSLLPAHILHIIHLIKHSFNRYYLLLLSPPPGHLPLLCCVLYHVSVPLSPACHWLC